MKKMKFYLMALVAVAMMAVSCDGKEPGPGPDPDKGGVKEVTVKVDNLIYYQGYDGGNFEQYVIFFTDEATKNEYYVELGEMLKHFDVVSFDNLALKQLETKRLLSEDQWNEFYMGDDGSHTMYIDCINKQFARSSVAPVEDRRDLMDDIKPMFDHIRSLAREGK
jgi:hypothetical protein